MTLSQRILAELTAGPRTTPDLVRRTARGMPVARDQVWSVLKRLERNGFVRRTGKVKTLWGPAARGWSLP